MLGQTSGDVRVSTSPRLTEGIGERGLVLVRAVVAEREIVAETVPVKPPGTIPVQNVNSYYAYVLPLVKNNGENWDSKNQV